MDRVGEMRQVAHFNILAILAGHGGLPIMQDSYVVGAIGVHGGGAEAGAAIASEAVG
jgi:uncharacterized protein GlcG (DUF336 family)